MASSFKKHPSFRPLLYRTPSPPRQAIEALSPTLNAAATTSEFFGDGRSIGVQDAQHQWEEAPGEGSQHLAADDQQAQRFNGSMDLFADIALATQSTRASLYANTLSCESTENASHEIARAPKKAKSESISSYRMIRNAMDPGTPPAIQQPLETRMLEAELLLNFSHRAREACASPTKHPAGTRQIRSTSGTMPRVPQCLSFSGEKNHDSDPAVNGKLPEAKFLSLMQTSAAAKDRIDIMAESRGLGSSNIATTQRIKEPAGSTMALMAFEAIDVTPGNHDIQIAPSDGQQVEGTTVQQEVQSKLPKHPDGNRTPKTFSDQILKHSLAHKTQEIVYGVSTVLNDVGLQKQMKHPSPGASEAPVHADTGLLTGQLRVAHARLNQAAENTVAGKLTTSEDIEQSPHRRISSPTIGATSNPLLSPACSPNSTAVCAVCSFAQNSLGIDSENNATSWISCDSCKLWFHFACAGFKNEREVRSVDKYRCRKCKPIHGSTTYVRKSSRAHSAIDYAGLHEGVIKTSDDRPEHHYIQPIKDGTIKFMPEAFARMRPELVTAEYFEKGVGMKEPIIIPAAFNPQPRPSTTMERWGNSQAGEVPQLGALEDNASPEAWFSPDLESQRILDEGQDSLDMVMPQGLTVRKVAELYGPEEKVEVIDVKSQNGENKKWNMRRWAEYYENQNNNKIVRNVISLEVSQSKLGRLIRRPQIVRDLDLQDSVWPEDLLAKGEFPHVQFYCLMSVADCFTDFHIDFGGSSVFYHILKGKKTFFFIPPKEKHLKKYEEWCMSPAQNWTFLPDQTKECYRVDLSEGDTMLIPSGWIHAVWTPEDSLVIGGNFLTRMNYGMQLRIAQVEKATGVARKFRYPHFQKLHWYTALRYVEDDPLPDNIRDLLENGGIFRRNKPAYYDFDEWGQNSRSGPERYNARYYSEPELDGLPDLTRYLLRTALIDIGSITEGISADTRNAVKKSIPRGHGEPLDIVKTFAIWCAWKRGNEPIPHWAYRDAVPETAGPDKLSLAASKKLDQAAALKAPRRQSARMQSYKDSFEHTATVLANGEAGVLAHSSPATGTKRPSDELNTSGQGENTISPVPKRPKMASGSGVTTHRKTACDLCRRRRRACKHKDQVEASTYNAQSARTGQNDLPLEVPLGGTALQEKLNLFGGLFDSAQAKSNGVQVRESTSGPQQDSNSVAPSHRFDNSSTLSSRIETPPRGQDFVRDLSTISSNVSLPRPRAKACNECRKSKVGRDHSVCLQSVLLTISAETVYT